MGGFIPKLEGNPLPVESLKSYEENLQTLEMREEIGFEIVDFRKCDGPVTLTLTFDNLEYYIVRFVSSTSNHSTVEHVAPLSFIVTLTLTFDDLETTIVRFVSSNPIHSTTEHVAPSSFVVNGRTFELDDGKFR